MAKEAVDAITVYSRKEVMRFEPKSVNETRILIHWS